MKAVRIHQFGGPEVLQYEEVPTPVPGPGEVLVKLAAAGLNYSDVHQRTGHFRCAGDRHSVSEEKAALARDTGADEVILYTKQDFERIVVSQPFRIIC